MPNIREEIEREENLLLSPYACRADRSRGRETEEAPDPVRTCFMRDRDRVIHSKSFRRLKHKTQVFIAPDNDHYRTRLTHTLEVSQIARTIGRGLRLNLDLIEAIALAHDVGHTPFAHVGEEVLDNLLPGGFCHNENSVRVLTRIEEGDSGRGLNLTDEVLDGVLWHSGLDEQPGGASTLEGQVIRLSDKIAYVQHDIDDSIRAGYLRPEDIPAEYLRVLGTTHSERIAALVLAVISQTRAALATGGDIRVTLSGEVGQALAGLRAFMFEHIYQGPRCREERERAARIVEYLFRHYQKQPELLPAFYRRIGEEEGVDRAVADYISGMSDNFCIAMFKEITIPGFFGKK
ncbi:MAG: deoxyguanosinetriphosphate triphosphohydrolase [bacterium]